MSGSAVLYRIISRNKDTEIGKNLNLSSIKTIEDYRDNVPLTDYEDYRPYIERMVEKGEENLLSPDKVTFYCPTSGTTAKSKLFPKFIPPGSRAPPQHFDQALMLCSLHQDKNTPLGVPIIPSLNAQTQAFLDRSESSFVAPRGAYQITDFMSAIYVQMVFGLKTSSVKCILAGFCSTVLTAFNLLAQEWEQMVNDIRNGTLKPSLNLTESQMITLEEALGDGDPQRADQLIAIMSESTKCGFNSVAHQLWPNLTRVIAIAGGSFAAYIPQTQHYLSDNVHIGSPVYISCECTFGVNKWPVSCVSAYSLLTSISFFEFIPLADADNTQPTTLLADEIKVGEVYEIVVTTSDGLYRYRNGDLIKVLEEGDGSEPPVIDVLGRKSVVLSIFGEKVTDYQLAAAITATTGPDGPWDQYFIQEYMMAANTNSLPPVYQLWVELSPKAPTSNSDNIQAILSEGAVYIDKKLAEVSLGYAHHRGSNTIGTMSVSEVNTGTFATVMSTMKKRSLVTESQLKIPHITADPQLIGVLQKSLK